MENLKVILIQPIFSTRTEWAIALSCKNKSAPRNMMRVKECKWLTTRSAYIFTKLLHHEQDVTK